MLELHGDGPWKKELQSLAETLGFPIEVSHFPAGTSRWNKTGHRLFSFISKNCRDVPTMMLQVVIELIKNTTTSRGLHAKAGLDEFHHETETKVSEG